MSTPLNEIEKRLLIAALVTTNCIAVTSCLQPRPSAECRAFYDLSPPERELRIRSSTLETQLVLYECGLYQEPPTDFASVVAEGGEKIIPRVFEKLRAENSDTRRDHLIHIFEEMALKARLVGKKEVIEQLRPIVSSMADGEIKRASQKRLEIIEKNFRGADDRLSQ
jgi:hypothetical protein